ncbi:MAG: hypothetical protein VB959_17660 [Rhodospirillales bacterium]
MVATSRIGIDFDNTIAGYDHLFNAAAHENGWLTDGAARTKREIRDLLRAGEDGDTKWQDLQARVYGPLMKQAELVPGAGEFLARCKHRSAEIFIVSHKTEFARRDRGDINLRTGSRQWMDQRGFFDPGTYAMDPANVYFESTREEKIQRIAKLGLRCFIDDLEEIFLDPLFPADVRQLHFAPGLKMANGTAYASFPTWNEISDAVFDDQN